MVVHQATPHPIRKLERFYAFEPPAEVRTILALAPDLVRVLQAAIEPLEQLFGQSAQRTLMSLDDPDDPDPPPHLDVLIRSPLSNDEVLRALETFDATWWFENAASTADRLTFDVRLA